MICREQVVSCAPVDCRLRPTAGDLPCHCASHAVPHMMTGSVSLCCSEDDSEPSEEGSEDEEAGFASQASGSEASEEPTNLGATDEEAEADVQPELPSYQGNGGAGGQAAPAPPTGCSACMLHNLCSLLPAELHSATQASWHSRCRGKVDQSQSQGMLKGAACFRCSCKPARLSEATCACALARPPPVRSTYADETCPVCR